MGFKFNTKIFVMGLLSIFAIASCNKSSAPEHDHVWDSGTMTTVATCHSEGVRTYKCTVAGCTQTKTESVAMTPHSWDEGVVTKDATCSSTGVMTYTCINSGCGKTKEVTLYKTDHDYHLENINKIPDLLESGEAELECSMCHETTLEELSAHADFIEQYDNDLFSWKYESLDTYLPTDEDISPNVLVKDGEVYKDDKVEISNGHIKTSGHALLSYSFNSDKEKIKANTSISFNGANADTRVEAYLLLTNKDNHVKKTIKVSSDSKDWTFTNTEENILELQENDNLCVVVSNNNVGISEGDLSITFTAECIHIWNMGEVIKPATEEQEGIREFTCISCNEKVQHVIPKVNPDDPDPEDPLEGYFDFTGKTYNRFEGDIEGNSWTTDNGHTLHVEVTKPGTNIWEGGVFVDTGLKTEAGKAFNINFEVSALEENDFEIVFQNKQWDETKYKTLYTPDGEVSEKINITEQNAGTLWLYIQSGNAINEVVITKLSIEETTPDEPEPPSGNYFDFTDKTHGRFEGGIEGNIWNTDHGHTLHIEVTKPGTNIWEGGVFVDTGFTCTKGMTINVKFEAARLQANPFEIIFQNKQWDETKYLTLSSPVGKVDEDIEVTEKNEGSLWIYVQFGNVVNEVTISNLIITEIVEE